MYTINWGDLTPELFLAEYWQKKPLLIKGGFQAFQDPISADELAGLAMEQELESRIIANDGSENGAQTNWQVKHGPFEGFSEFGEENWTLLVQAVNNWSETTAQMLEPFKFLPSWRIDDVMVSFSTPGGGVGPHLDQYDVFITQGEGKRRWQVGLPDDSLAQLLPHEDLKQVSPFKPVIDAITEPGDILYIPPNHPHDGVSIDNSLNYSVGFQAPNGQDMISALADAVIDKQLAEHRFNDPERTVTNQPELLATEDVKKLRQFMLAQTGDLDLFSDMIATFTTRSHHALEVLIPMEPFTEEAVKDYLADPEIFVRPVLGVKALINEQNGDLYINGDRISLIEQTRDLGQLLAKNVALTTTQLKSFTNCLNNTQMLTKVLNMGYWYID
ncbi:cupin domain-containing protein [Thalassotalea euphylliae]|uniref:Cupin domain-containing protein n=1 Tax=Thalassotalea euphylliae TaxID=1655234 RepID=A0A3E0TQ93_9GAMM|nr:cupin domain-containing protein [Thalassotalea euphylliae]REL26811.1 cupin domain-containing protein [Thalassotalea euphylliae]